MLLRAVDGRGPSRVGAGSGGTEEESRVRPQPSGTRKNESSRGGTERLAEHGHCREVGSLDRLSGGDLRSGGDASVGGKDRRGGTRLSVLHGEAVPSARLLCRGRMAA